MVCHVQLDLLFTGTEIHVQSNHTVYQSSVGSIPGIQHVYQQLDALTGQDRILVPFNEAGSQPKVDAIQVPVSDTAPERNLWVHMVLHPGRRNKALNDFSSVSFCQ